jgi:hypothetical protein
VSPGVPPLVSASLTLSLMVTMCREEMTVDQSLLTVDRQMGLVICTPDGKVRDLEVRGVSIQDEANMVDVIEIGRQDGL